MLDNIYGLQIDGKMHTVVPFTYVYSNKIVCCWIVGENTNNSLSYIFVDLDVEKFHCAYGRPAKARMVDIDFSLPFVGRRMEAAVRKTSPNPIVYVVAGIENTELYICKYTALDKTCVDSYVVVHKNNLSEKVGEKKEDDALVEQEECLQIKLPKAPKGYKWKVCLELVSE